MNRRHLFAVVLLLSSGAALTALAGSSDLLDALMQRPAEGAGTVIIPGTHLRRWDPITLFHPSSRAKAGPEDHPERFVELDPAQPGAWTWLDAKTLQFRPAEPWSPMSLVTVRTKDARADLFTLSPPPTRSVPRANSTTSGPVDRIELTFENPIAPHSLARVTSIEVRPRPGLSDDGLVVLGPDDFEVKALLRSNNQEHSRYALILNEPIQRGATVRVRVGLSLDAEAEEAVHVIEFHTPEPFRITELGCRGNRLPVAATGTLYPPEQPIRCTHNRAVDVAFNAIPADIGPIAARNLVRFEPAVTNLQAKLSGTQLHLEGDFHDDQLYKISLHPTLIRDRADRDLQLDGESVVHLVFPRRNPYIRWGSGEGILERFGPHRVPLEGRGVQTVDLRIYTIDPLNRELWPFPSSPIAVDEAARPPGPGEEPDALDLTGIVSTDGLRRRLHALGSPGFSEFVDVPLSGASGRGGLDLTRPLTQLSGARTPGHYLVGMREVDGARERKWMRIQVTDLALSTIETEDEVHFLVTSLSTGEPVPGASITMEGVVHSNERARWTTRKRLTTGADGSVRWSVPGKGGGDVRRISVQRGKDVLVLDGLKAPEAFARGHWRNDRNNWLSWAFNDLDKRRPQVFKLGHLFPERPVYRPEEEVFLKGYARRRNRGVLSPITGKGTVEIQGPGASWSLPTTLSKLGSFHVTWDETDLPTGTYTARYVHSDGQTLARTHFQVEAYRLPTFEVELETEENQQRVANDAPFDVTATASYYAGGNVANRPIRWSVTQFPFAWNPDGPKGFAYSSDGRYARTERFDSTPALDRAQTTDTKGRSVLQLDPSIEPNAQPRTYVIEATVTDADEQTVTTTHRVDAVPAFVLGLKAPRYQERAGRLSIEAIAVGPDGELIAGKDVTIRLLQRQWHSMLQASDFSDGVARYVTDVVDVPLSTQTVQTTTSPTALDLDLDGAGVYIVELEASDALGRVQVVTTDLFAGGKGDISWAKPEQGVFNVRSEKPSWRPGQTAKLVLQSPFSTGQALVVIETPDQNLYRSVTIRGGNAVVSIPVKEGWVPKIPVHVLLRKGRDPNAGVLGGTDLGKPQTVATTHWLNIEPVENIVEVSLIHPERATPGETLPVTIELKTPDGKPLSGEVTLWLVDQAVLALGREQALDPRPDFIRTQASRLKARVTRNLAFGRLPFHEMPGGDGGAEMDDDADNLLDQTSIRKNFKSVPYYEPALLVPASGKLTVQVQLPDNLTVFKIRAKAIHGAERFGAGKSSLRVRLPVLLQPDLPRFVRPGDQLEVAALGRVVEGTGGAGQAQISVEGLDLSSSTNQTFRWVEDGSTRIGWPVTVPTSNRDEVVVTIAGERMSDGAGDAVQIRLPIRDDRRPRTTREIVALPVAGRAELKALREDARPGTLKRTVVLSDHPGIVKMAGSMDVLLTRKPQSSGQALDLARAWLALGELRETLGQVGREQVDQAVSEALASIKNAVDGRGRIASWPGGTGKIVLTADALEFMVEASEAGYSPDEALQKQLIRTLNTALRSDYQGFVDGASWYERSRALQALARVGSFSEPYFSELGDKSRYLGSLGKASVLLAANSAGRGKGRLASELGDSLEEDVLVGLFEGEERYQGLKSAGSPQSPFIASGETYSVAVIARSLLAARPSSPKTEMLVDALVRLGGDDGWGGRADTPALFALNERLSQRTGETVSATFDGQSLQAKRGVGRMELKGEGVVEVKHEGGPAGILYARTTYLPNQPGSEADALREGFVVTREQRIYTDGTPGARVELDEGGRELSLPLGTVLEDHVQITTPADHAYVVITVPLAAGMEPLNPELRTSPPEARASKTDTLRATWRVFGDDAITYHFEWLPKGTYDVRFRSRATTAGRFVQPPAVAELVFEPAVMGQSPGAWVGIQ